MIQGIGIDMVTISEMDRILKRLSEGGIARMFTAAEVANSCYVSNSSEYLATRFAVKEAVFKAVSSLLNDEPFDLRMVETLNREDGSPFVNENKQLRDILDRAGVRRLHISITTESDFATAFVIAEGERH